MNLNGEEETAMWSEDRASMRTTGVLTCIRCDHVR
jgi:hypothetical protein